MISQQLVQLDPMSNIAEHLKEVARWLDENVESYPTPKAITMSDFSVNWAEMSGSFVLTLDDHRIKERFRFSLAQNGWVQYHLPMFTSPLGAPASYGAADLTDETARSLTKALMSIFPRLKPMGVDAVTGVLIGQRTSIADRVLGRGIFDAVISKVSAMGFSLTAIV